jgi:NADH dehydrogenase FAD-containing subunit
LQSDVKKWFPDLIPHIKVTLVEAGPGLLGSFHKSLAEYYLKSLKKRKIDVRLSTSVVAVQEGYYDSPGPENLKEDVILHSKGEGSHYTAAVLADGTELPFGAMVWSAGLAPVRLVQNAGLELQRGRIVVDEFLRVPGTKGRIYAAGDCATLRDHPLPPTASVAEQQAYYLGECFNAYYSAYDVKRDDIEGEVPLPGPVVPALIPWENLAFLNKVLCKSAPIFQYKNRGAMAVIGFGDAVTDLTDTDLPSPKTTMSGFLAFLTWRGTYLTKQLSWSNMMLIPMVRNPSALYHVTHAPIAS